jgi:site-specific recombinase XerD
MCIASRLHTHSDDLGQIRTAAGQHSSASEQPNPAAKFAVRHSVASFAIDQGESLYVGGRAMGHRKAATKERYAHVRDALAQRVVAGVGARLASLAADSDKSEE